MSNIHEFSEHKTIQLVIKLSIINTNDRKRMVENIIKDALNKAFKFPCTEYYPITDEILENNTKWSVNLDHDDNLYVLMKFGVVFRKDAEIEMDTNEYSDIKKVFVELRGNDHQPIFEYYTFDTTSKYDDEYSKIEKRASYVGELTVNKLMALARDWDLDITISSEGLHVLDGDTERQADLTFEEFGNFIKYKELSISTIIDKFK